MALFEKKDVKEGAGRVAETTDSSLARIAEHVLLRPRLTEKAYLANESNQYVFQVAQDASKGAIRRAVEAAYGVRVEKVRTIATPRKRRNFGRFQGWKSGMRKAIVTIPAGESLPIFKKAE